MPSKLKPFGQVIISLIVAAAIMATAYFSIGPPSTWLYLVGVWALLSAAFELYVGLRARARR